MIMSQKSPANSYATPADQSPYDFMNTGEPIPQKSGFGGNMSFRAKLLILIGGAIALMAVAAIVIGFFIKSGGATIEQTRAIAAQQTELIRIADIGVKKAHSETAKNLAFTTKTTLTSDQQATLSYLTSQKQKVSSKDLATSKSSKTDIQLTQAEQTNQFDDVFIQIMKQKLADYQTKVKTAYDGATSKKAKAVLADNYNHVSALLTN
jgi:hypothetical protein